MKPWIILCLVVAGLILAFVRVQTGREGKLQQPDPAAASLTVASDQSEAIPDCCVVPLAPHQGEERIDREIQRLQALLSHGTNSPALMERLGWAYVAKGRASFDPGFYKIAEQCAFCLRKQAPESLEAMLLQGHVLQNLHRFKEAEPLARELAQKRGLPFDFGLLGDVLLDLGRLDEAVVAYQSMMDLRPDLQSYARGAQIRWLKGDLDGAIELMEVATSASSPLDTEPAAWVWTRLANYEFQNKDTKKALQGCEQALALRPDYAPALLLRGRIELANDQSENAVTALQRAVALNPLPEYQWALIEALCQDGRSEEALAVQAQMRRDGAVTDPRTYALYLATKGESVPTAVQLATNELQERGDIFTHDALSWSLAAAGQYSEAWERLQQALKEGTKDARLFYHATVIAAKVGRDEEARRYFERASNFWAQLLPSEQAHLEKTIGDLERRERTHLLSLQRPAADDSDLAE